MFPFVTGTLPQQHDTPGFYQQLMATPQLRVEKSVHAWRKQGDRHVLESSDSCVEMFASTTEIINTVMNKVLAKA